MAELNIGEVEELTGVKAHVLRYWEENIPLLAPRKNIGGRRVYSVRDVQIIVRLKYLIQEKKFTIEGACEELIRELTDPVMPSVNYALNMLRSDLTELYAFVRRGRGRGARYRKESDDV